MFLLCVVLSRCWVQTCNVSISQRSKFMPHLRQILKCRHFTIHGSYSSQPVIVLLCESVYMKHCGWVLQKYGTKALALQQVKGKGNPYLITKRRVPELIPVCGSQPAGDESHKPGSWLPLLSTKPAVPLTTLRRAAATNFAVCWTEARWAWTVCLRLLPDSVTAAI